MKQNLMVFFNTIRFYFYIVKSDGIGKYQTCENIYFFFILQCQWHQHGSEVLENTLLILRGWGNTSSSVGFASGGRKYCLNLSGFWGYFPIPPRHADAIVTILTLTFFLTYIYMINFSTFITKERVTNFSGMYILITFSIKSHRLKYTVISSQGRNWKA